MTSTQWKGGPSGHWCHALSLMTLSLATHQVRPRDPLSGELIPRGVDLHVHTASHISVAGVAQLWAQSHGLREELCLKLDGDCCARVAHSTGTAQRGYADSNLLRPSCGNPEEDVPAMPLCDSQLRGWTGPALQRPGRQGGQGVPACGCLSVVSRQGVSTPSSPQSVVVGKTGLQF